MAQLDFTLLCCLIASTLADFVPGRMPPGSLEYPELSGKMTPKEAVRKCEEDDECAGFTYLGSLDLKRKRQIAFYR